MASHYQYIPEIWLMLSTVACPAVLGLYALRRRAVPGAIPFIALCAVIILWSLASLLRQTATVDELRAFWFKFEAAFLMPAVVAEMCFITEYAGLGRWLTRRTLVLLAVAPLLYWSLIVTNEFHHLVWTRTWFEGYLRTEFGPANWVAVSYGYVLSLIQLGVLVWLFARSPRHRWIAGALILTTFTVRFCYILRVLHWDRFATIDPVVYAMPIGVLAVALAFFRFHIFDVLHVARDTVVERMPEGMMVIDAGDRVVDVNDKVLEFLGVARSQVIGRPVGDVLRDLPPLLKTSLSTGAAQEELPLGDRWILATLSPLVDRRGLHLGRLLWLRDVTERRRAQERFLDQQRTLAVLEERELLGRELHDGIGQMLAAAQLQTRSAMELLSRGETAMAASCLRRVADVTQEAKDSVRTYLHGVKSISGDDQGVLSRITRYIETCRKDYGLSVSLTVSPGLEGKRVGSAVEAQLLPIVQEALTNVQRHGGAGSVRVTLAADDGQIRATVEDDGRGFDPAELGRDQGFGIRSMKGRAEAVGGVFELESKPGQGTRVSVSVPWKKEHP